MQPGKQIFSQQDKARQWHFPQKKSPSADTENKNKGESHSAKNKGIRHLRVYNNWKWFECRNNVKLTWLQSYMDRY